MVVCFQSTPASVGGSLWNRSCGDGNCSRRATDPLGIDTLIANILVSVISLPFLDYVASTESAASCNTRQIRAKKSEGGIYRLGATLRILDGFKR